MFKHRKLGPVSLVYVRTGRDHLVGLTWGHRMVRLRLPLPGWRGRAWERMCWATLSLRVWPLYAEQWSRDCDQVEATSAHKFWTGVGFKRAVLASYEHAEGPVRWTRLTRREYLSHEASFRDRRAEQMGY
jgi:hypothetical protein